jgi:hypothetical protein
VLLLARSLAGLIVAELAAVMLLLGLNASLVDPGRMSADVIFAFAVVLYAGAGLLITNRMPGNAIGWLLSLIGVTLAASMLTEQYALYGLATAPGSVPAAHLAGWLSGMLASLTLMLLFLVLLLFPDGQLPSRRWRPLLWALAAVTAADMATFFQAGTITGGITNALNSARARYLNPVGIIPQHGWFSGIAAVTFSLTVITGLLAVAAIFARRRDASTERRKQLAWPGYIGLLTALWASVLLAGNLGWPSKVWLGNIVFALLALTLVAGTPVACAVAMLKYRLYDIDRIISRTLEYAIVTGLLVGMYAGLVLLTTQVLTIKSPVAVAGSTLVAAALFSPLRRRVQQAVDRRFNRARYDAEQTIAAFADQLKDAVDLDTVQADLANVVHQVLQPTHLWMWTRDPD